ncbi:hypothetical protein K461DRAFT_280901 [Myriangium duriaei CBS 260.36]|uniref:Metallo-beta-lactamase domain-containing protein n=1 Tax=Myriangium duriaei CBS 260.36 TaxID=1168546 RepID=A0A9P4IZV7_9PEZI|nr:hypothetical protein K461DRAFT_280901 [Myriangium duriaei CBS 260.36]
MSLKVDHLNADTTFLLTFSPDVNSTQGPASEKFTVLVDPWLAGSSEIWTPKFSISHHTSASVVSSLADMPLPDLIIISQDKSDHCHEATLKTLPSDSQVHILAMPSAAKKIKSWRYFTHANIESFPTYNPKNQDSVVRIPLMPTKALSGRLGEMTISFIPQKLDMTNLHNVIGFTYQPPYIFDSRPQQNPTFELPLSPPMTPTASQSPSSQTPSQDLTALSAQAFPIPPRPRMDSPDSDAHKRPLSVLYAPHGIGIPCITPFMKNHLAPMNALPLTLLFHCINVEQNPWWLGGMVAPGLPGGTALVKTFGAKTWLSAHDEAKDNSGWATALIKSRQYTMDEAQVLLDHDLEKAAEESGNSSATSTQLVNLGVGERLTVTV